MQRVRACRLSDEAGRSQGSCRERSSRSVRTIPEPGSEHAGISPRWGKNRSPRDDFTRRARTSLCGTATCRARRPAGARPSSDCRRRARGPRRAARARRPRARARPRGSRCAPIRRVRRPRRPTSRRSSDPRSSAVTGSESVNSTTRSMTFCSSRTLPGHVCCRIACSASGDSGLRAAAYRRLACSRKPRASTTASSPRSRSGGMRIDRHRQPLVEVVAELAEMHRGLDVTAGRRHDLHVDRAYRRRADPPHRLLLDDLQELGLE